MKDLTKKSPSQVYLWPTQDIADVRQRQAPETRARRRIAFGWYGGKFNHLRWLLPLLPKCHHYCEPYAGSAAVLLNRDPSPVETYNDIDGEVVNFFRALRDRKDELVEAIALTPFSREEFFRALSNNGEPVSELERARRFFVRARQVRTGLAQTASLGRWANCKRRPVPACRAWFRAGSAVSKCFRKSQTVCYGCKLRTDPPSK